MRYYSILIFTFWTLITLSCSVDNKTKNIDNNKIFEVELADSNANAANKKNEDVVFYNMFSPLDLNKVIDQKSSYFNSSYVNSLNNITKYASSHKMALNIGVYGADLSYLWMFDQTQQAISYLSAIQHLTNKLGIPKNFVETTIRSAEQNLSDMDTLISIARNAYNATDRYLKESDRESSAVLILLGGWIETLNIALNMYTESNSKLASKIISQKYSLNSLIKMVQNSHDDMVMSEYLLLMKKLNEEFKVLESQLKPEDIEIDTTNKRIAIKESININIAPQQFSEIKRLTSQIRDHIIE